MMPVHLLHIGVFVLFSFASQAQALRYKTSAPYLGTGAYTASHADAFSPLENIASLASFSVPCAGIHAENRFLIEELTSYAAIVNIPTARGNFAFTADYFGFEHFRETQIGAAYARQLAPSLMAAVKFNYYSFQIPTVVKSGAPTVELGLIATLTEQFRVGFQVYNPMGGNLSRTRDEKLASQYRFGMGYQTSKNFSVSAHLGKQEREPLNVSASMQYHFEGAFFARAGVATQNSVFFGGAGWQKNRLRVDAMASVHPQLGVSPGILFLFEFKKPHEIR